ALHVAADFHRRALDQWPQRLRDAVIGNGEVRGPARNRTHGDPRQTGRQRMALAAGQVEADLLCSPRRAGRLRGGRGAPILALRLDVCYPDAFKEAPELERGT